MILVYLVHFTNKSCTILILNFDFFQDLLRTMPSNACFCNINSTGIPRLRRILRGLAWLYPDIGYCQGTGVVRLCIPYLFYIFSMFISDFNMLIL